MSILDYLICDAATAVDSPTGYDSETGFDSPTSGGPLGTTEAYALLFTLFTEYGEGISREEIACEDPHLLDTFDSWAGSGIITDTGPVYRLTALGRRFLREVL